MVFSNNPEADRTFARELFGLVTMDAGGGWLLFILPPGQSGIDPFGCDDAHQLYLECRDLDQAIAAISERGIEANLISAAGGRRFVSLALPGGGLIRLHERPDRPA